MVPPHRPTLLVMGGEGSSKKEERFLTKDLFTISRTCVCGEKGNIPTECPSASCRRSLSQRKSYLVSVWIGQEAGRADEPMRLWKEERCCFW